jgi:hypothetical protein
MYPDMTRTRRLPMKARVTVSLPSEMKTLMEEANAVGTVVKLIDHAIVVEIENESEFKLGQTVSHFESTVDAIDLDIEVTKVEGPFE